MQKSLNIEEVLEFILSYDKRYDIEAYYFVREALGLAQKRLSRAASQGPQHVTGKQLLEVIRTHALERFGPATLEVLRGWGVRRCEDFGEIVFNMAETSLLGTTENDSREDFKDGYDFREAFGKP